MKKVLIAVLLLTALAAFGQVTNPNGPSFSVGEFYAPAYNYQTSVYSGGSTTSGAYTINVFTPQVMLPDHRAVTVFSTATAFTIGQGSSQETVTPTTVSGCTAGQPNRNCAITATFSNAHGKGDIIQSSTNGYAEALLDAANQGGGKVFFVGSEQLTLATGTTTTDTVGNLLPANSVIEFATGIVKTAITGTCSAWGIGDATTATRFTPTTIALTAGIKSTSVLPAYLGTAIASATTGMQQGLTAAKVRITCATGNPSAGAVKVTVGGYTFVAPN